MVVQVLEELAEHETQDLRSDVSDAHGSIS
jgi:hypothetical protein